MSNVASSGGYRERIGSDFFLSTVTMDQYPMTSIATRILKRMHLRGFKHAYWIGGTGECVTFLAQQQRALNLAWALCETRSISSTSNVAVIGAGLAGITFAVAAKLKGAKVTLLEKASKPLHLQRGTMLRYVHPNIYDWPNPGSDETQANLPFFKWSHGTAGDIVNVLSQDWTALSEGIIPKFHYKVVDVRPFRQGKIIVKADSITHKEAPFRQKFDCVVVATGLGLERQLKNVQFLSYWDNDNFDRAVLRPPIPRKFLVTGCGDGGLIDAIRLCLSGFDHREFIDQLVSWNALKQINGKLLDLDKRAKTEHSPPEEQGLFLDDEYDELFEHLIKDEWFDKMMEKVGRLDTDVYLNGPHKTPYSVNSSLLNRVSIFLLINEGWITYLPGRVAVGQIGFDSLTVSFTDKHHRLKSETFHELVVRHGPDPAIEELFPKPEVLAKRTVRSKTKSRRSKIKLDITRFGRYRFDYWDEELRILLHNAEEGRSQLKKEITKEPVYKAGVVYEVGLEKKGGSALMHMTMTYIVHNNKTTELRWPVYIASPLRKIESSSLRVNGVHRKDIGVVYSGGLPGQGVYCVIQPNGLAEVNSRVTVEYSLLDSEFLSSYTCATDLSLKYKENKDFIPEVETRRAGNSYEIEPSRKNGYSSYEIRDGVQPYEGFHLTWKTR